MKSPRKVLPRFSEKRRAALKGKRVWSTIKKKKRSKSEFSRIYGSKERVSWVSWQRCVGCGSSGCGPHHNHHIETDGIGRKASASKIVPLCHACHIEVHAWGRPTFEEEYGIDLEVEAKETHAAWLSHIADSPKEK